MAHRQPMFLIQHESFKFYIIIHINFSFILTSVKILACLMKIFNDIF
jgi:hypothetical protein